MLLSIGKFCNERMVGLPISEDALRAVAEVFIGDRNEFFPYMKGPQIVDFFNQYFGYKEEYQWGGAPTRWVYARDKIAEIINSGRADAFFSTILGYQYMMRIFGCNETDARKKAAAAEHEFNRVLKPEGYGLAGADGSFSLIKIDDDLILLGEGGFARAYLQKSTGLVVKKLNSELIPDDGCRHRFKREYSIMHGFG